MISRTCGRSRPSSGRTCPRSPGRARARPSARGPRRAHDGAADNSPSRGAARTLPPSHGDARCSPASCRVRWLGCVRRRCGYPCRGTGYQCRPHWGAHRPRVPYVGLNDHPRSHVPPGKACGIRAAVSDLVGRLELLMRQLGMFVYIAVEPFLPVPYPRQPTSTVSARFDEADTAPPIASQDPHRYG